MHSRRDLLNVLNFEYLQLEDLLAIMLGTNVSEKSQLEAEIWPL